MRHEVHTELLMMIRTGRCHRPTGASSRKVRTFQEQSARDCEGGFRSRRVTNQWRMVGQVAAYERWSPILSTHYSTAEAARDSNCLHLHKSIDLPDLLGCPAVSIHLWMHAYSKLQCPQAELWVANRCVYVYVCVCVSLSLTLPLSRSHLLPICSHPFHGRAEGCTTAAGVTSTLVTALYWIVNDIPPPSLLLLPLPCLALPKNVSITKNTQPSKS